jgi:prepilin-type N-terminal cleavage/methylation domain-containing protein
MGESVNGQGLAGVPRVGVSPGTKFAGSGRRQGAGHTLVEVAVALAIVAVLAAIGLSSARDEINRYHLMKAARRLHADVLYLKSEAITSNREMRLKLVAYDEAMDASGPQEGEWLLQAGNRASMSTSWDTLPVDVDGVPDESDGVRDLGVDGTEEATSISLAPWPALAGPGSTGESADAIVFSPRGMVANPPTDFVNGYVTLTLVNKAAAQRGGEEEVRVRISRGGLARLETGASSTLPENDVGTGEATTR